MPTRRNAVSALEGHNHDPPQAQEQLEEVERMEVIIDHDHGVHHSGCPASMMPPMSSADPLDLVAQILPCAPTHMEAWPDQG